MLSLFSVIILAMLSISGNLNLVVLVMVLSLPIVSQMYLVIIFIVNRQSLMEYLWV